MKYKVEKALHECIRDLPEALKLEEAAQRGIISPLDALKGITALWDAELDRVASEINANWDN